MALAASIWASRNAYMAGAASTLDFASAVSAYSKSRMTFGSMSAGVIPRVSYSVRASFARSVDDLLQLFLAPSSR